MQKIIVIATASLFVVGGALHIGTGNKCPFDKSCQKMFKSEKAAESHSSAKIPTEKIINL